MEKAYSAPHTRRAAVKGWIAAHVETLLCAGIALIMLALLVLYAGKKSFFSDELDQLGILISCHSLSDVLAIYAGMGHEVAPPLFAVVAWVWYRLAPLSQRWLLILPAIACSVGVFFTGMSGRLFGGKRVAVLSALFACALPAMATTVGTQFRQYAFVFLFASLTLFLFLRRLRHGRHGKWLDSVLYGVAMAGLPYAHYLSVFVCFYLFAVDVVLVFRKRIRWECLLSYILGAALFAPWGVAILPSAARIASFWIPVPRILDIRDALYFLTDAFSVYFILYIGGLCTSATALIRPGTKTAFPGGWRGLDFVFAAAAPIMITVVYLYSKYFSRGVSLFLPRYFICVLPMIVLTGALFADRVFRLCMAARPLDLRRASMAFILTCAVLSGMSAWQNVQQYTSEVLEPYREAADFLYLQPDIGDANVAVITSGESAYVTAGLNALYMTRGGERPPAILFDRAHPFTEADAEKYDNVYVVKIHAALPAESEKTLLERYQRHMHMTEGAQWNVWYYGRIAE